MAIRWQKCAEIKFAKAVNGVTLSWMVATPRNMKMIVSEEPLNIFMAYFRVV